MTIDAIKIQVNTEEGLKTLLNGDPIFEATLKQSIMVNMAKAYETVIQKRYVDDVIVRDIVGKLDKAKEGVESKFFDFQRGKYGNKIPVLKPEYEKIISDKVDARFDELFKSKMDESEERIIAKVTERLQKMDVYYTDYLEKVEKQASDRCTEAVVSGIVEKRVKDKLAELMKKCNE